MKKKWTAEMEIFIKKNYKNKPDEWLAKRLGCSRRAIERKRLALGLKRERTPHRGPINRKDGWTELETEYLKMGYGKVSNKRLAKVLKRPLGTVCSKLNRMGLTGGGAWIRDEYEIMIVDEVECAKFLELEDEIRQMRSV